MSKRRQRQRTSGTRARRERVNAILFSVLLITSVVAGVAALGGPAAADNDSEPVLNSSSEPLATQQTESTTLMFEDGTSSKELNNYYEVTESVLRGTTEDSFTSKGSVNHLVLTTDRFELGSIPSVSQFSNQHIYLRFEGYRRLAGGDLTPYITPVIGASGEDTAYNIVEQPESQGNEWNSYTVEVDAEYFKDNYNDIAFQGEIGAQFTDDGLRSWEIRDVELIGWRQEPNSMRTETFDDIRVSPGKLEEATLEFDYSQTEVSEAFHDPGSTLRVEAQNVPAAPPDYEKIFSTDSNSGTAEIDILGELQQRGTDDLAINFLAGAGGAYEISNVKLNWEVSQETLSVDSSPDGADVYLDGDQVDTTPWSEELPVTESYDIEVDADDYQSASESGVSPGADLDFDLDPEEAELSVTSSPDGADVYLDGNRVGTTPWSEDRPVTESYDIEVDKDDYQSESESDVSPGADLDFDLDSEEAELSVTSSPGGADVYLDSNRVGTTPWSEDRPVTESYDIEVDADGYQSQERTDISPPASEDFDLNPIPDDEFFAIEITDTNEPVIEGEDLEVTAEIENEGDVSDTQTVELDVSGLGTDSESVQLDGGDSQTETFSVSTTDGDDGSYTAEVKSDDASDSTSVTVQADEADPFFAVEVTDTNSPAEEGETLEVTAEIENTGDLSDSQAVELNVDGLDSDSTSVSLDGGESSTETLSVATDQGDVGDYTAEVTTDDDRATTPVTIQADEAGPFLAVESMNTNSPIEEGETLEVTAEIENVGDKTAAQEISLEINESTVDTEAVGIAGGESEPITLEWGTDESNDGEYEASVATQNETESTSVTVISADPAVVSGTVINNTDTGLSNATVRFSPSANETIQTTVETDANGLYIAEVPPGEYEITAAKDGFEPTSQVVTAEAGRTTTADFVLSSFETITVTELEPAEAVIEPGDGIDVIAEITNEGAPETANVEFSIADQTETRNVTVDDEPVSVEFSEVGGELEPGDYTYTVATGFDTREGTLIVEKNESTDRELITAPEAVEANDEFTFEVTADDVDQITVDGDIEDFTVVEFNEFAISLATNPDPIELPTVLEAGDEISTGQLEPGELTLSVELNATVAEGEYEFTATARDTAADAPGQSETVTVNVTEDTASVPEEPTAEDFITRDEAGNVEDVEVFDAIDDFRSDQLESGELFDVISAFREA